MGLRSWLRQRRSGRGNRPLRRHGAGPEEIYLTRLLQTEQNALAKNRPPGTAPDSPYTAPVTASPSGDTSSPLQTEQGALADGLPPGSTTLGNAPSNSAASSDAIAKSVPPKHTSGPPEQTLTAGEAAVEASVRGTQELAERRFINALARGGQRLQQDAWEAAEARRVAGLATADPIGKAAKTIAEEQSIKSLKNFDERHEPGGGKILLIVLVGLAFLGDLGFLYSIFARSIRANDPWWIKALAIGMAVALAAVSVALADVTGRQLRPLWSGDPRKKISAILRAAVPLILTIVASIATWHMVEWRYEQVTPGVITKLPAELIATFVVALLWMILVLESQRPSVAPMVDPRVRQAADEYITKREEATAKTVRADMKHDHSWLELADRADQTLTAIQEVYVPGAHVVLEHRANHGIERTPLLATPDAANNTEEENFPARFDVPEVLHNSRFVGRKFHHLERALGLLRAHQPAGVNSAQTIVERLYDQLDRVIVAQRRAGLTPAEQRDQVQPDQIQLGQGQDGQEQRHYEQGGRRHVPADKGNISDPVADSQTVPFNPPDPGINIVRQNHQSEHSAPKPSTGEGGS